MQVGIWHLCLCNVSRKKILSIKMKCHFTTMHPLWLIVFLCSKFDMIYVQSLSRVQCLYSAYYWSAVYGFFLQYWMKILWKRGLVYLTMSVQFWLLLCWVTCTGSRKNGQVIEDKWDEHVLTWILNDSGFWWSKTFIVGRFDPRGSSHSRSNLVASKCKLNFTGMKSSSISFHQSLFHLKLPLDAKFIKVWSFNNYS